MHDPLLAFWGFCGALVFGTARLNAVFWTEKDSNLKHKLIAEWLTSLITGSVFGYLGACAFQAAVAKMVKLNSDAAAGLLGLVCNYWPDLINWYKRKFLKPDKADEN